MEWLLFEWLLSLLKGVGIFLFRLYKGERLAWFGLLFVLGVFGLSLRIEVFWLAVIPLVWLCGAICLFPLEMVHGRRKSVVRLVFIACAVLSTALLHKHFGFFEPHWGMRIAVTALVSAALATLEAHQKSEIPEGPKHLMGFYMLGLVWMPTPIGIFFMATGFRVFAQELDDGVDGKVELLRAADLLGFYSLFAISAYFGLWTFQ